MTLVGLTLATALWLSRSPVPLGQEAALLPEGNAYIRGVVGGGRPQDAAINDFTYDLEETRETLDEDGRTKSRETRRFEVYFVRTRPVRRLVSKDGVPLSAKEQSAVDKKAESQAKAIADGQTVSEQPGIRLSSLLDSFEFKTVGREEQGGRSVLVLDFAPRRGGPQDPPKNRAERAFTRVLNGRVHVDEADRRVTRLEARNSPGEKASINVAVKLQAFEVLMEFSLVEKGVWLPLKVVTLASGKAFFFRTFRIRQTSTYSNYRRFRVDTEEHPAR